MRKRPFEKRFALLSMIFCSLSFRSGRSSKTNMLECPTCRYLPLREVEWLNTCCTQCAHIPITVLMLSFSCSFLFRESTFPLFAVSRLFTLFTTFTAFRLNHYRSHHTELNALEESEVVKHESSKATVTVTTVSYGFEDDIAQPSAKRPRAPR